jgi:cytochrome o ubiquinol oxidase subunit 2
MLTLRPIPAHGDWQRKGQGRSAGRVNRLRFLAPLAVVGLAACSPGVLDPAGPVSAGNRTILLNSLFIMLGIVIPTMIVTLAFAWWFRAGNKKAKYLPEWSYSGRVELLVWSIPALIVIFLAGVTWIGTHQLAPERPLDSKVRPVTVQVVSLDWKWLFIYPEQGVASVNRLVIPAGTPINFRVTSGTVMNSFFVPQLGSQIYAMAGMSAKLHLQADRPGRYRGMSAHYSGEGFSDMDFPADAVPPRQFAAWVARTRAQGPALDNRGFVQLARKSVDVKPYTYRAVQPGLYELIVRNAGAPVSAVATGGREDTK